MQHGMNSTTSSKAWAYFSHGRYCIYVLHMQQLHVGKVA